MTPDTTLLNRWLTEYRRLIYRVVMSSAASGAEQDDLFQEIAIALWRSTARFEGRSQETTWIYRVALNTAISFKRGAPQPPPTDQAELLPAETSVEQEQELDWLYRRLRELDPVDRSIVVLYLDGTSYADMASILGISESSVGVKINRVKQKLKMLIGAQS